jgi:hypothetical protein
MGNLILFIAALFIIGLPLSAPVIWLDGFFDERAKKKKN